MRSRLAGAVVSVALVAACESERPLVPARPPVDGCAVAASRYEALSADGDVARAARALDPSPACARLPVALSVKHGVLLAELGDAARAAKIAAELEPTNARESRSIRDAIARFAPRAPPPESRGAALDAIDRAAEAAYAKDHRAAFEGYQRAWEAWHPRVDLSIGAGTAARALGRHADARRLFARAFSELTEKGVVSGYAERPQAISDDGALIALDDHVIDRASGRVVAVLDRPADGPSPVGFSFDRSSRRLARLEATGTVVGVYHALSGRLLSRHVLPSGWNTQGGRPATAFAPDGRSLAFSTPHGVGVVNIASGEVRTIPQAAASSPGAFAWSSDGSRLAVGALDNVDVHDASSLRRIRTCRVSGQVTSLRMRGGDRELDVGTISGPHRPGAAPSFFARCDLINGTIVARLTPPEGAGADRTVAAELSADGETMARMSPRDGLELWDLARGERRSISRSPAWRGDGGARLLFARSHDAVIGACAHRGLCAYDARAGADPAAAPRVVLGLAQSWAVAPSSNGNAIVTLDPDEQIRVWDLVRGSLDVVPLSIGGCDDQRETVVFKRSDNLGRLAFTPKFDPRIVDVSADASSFRVTACGRSQEMRFPALAGARGAGEPKGVVFAAISGARAGVVWKGGSFDIVGPDADAPIARASLLCSGRYPIEVCEDAQRVRGLLRAP